MRLASLDTVLNKIVNLWSRFDRLQACHFLLNDYVACRYVSYLTTTSTVRPTFAAVVSVVCVAITFCTGICRTFQD
jgi:hypothetical protein